MNRWTEDDQPMSALLYLEPERPPSLEPSADDSCADASLARALARPQRQSSQTLPLPSAATTQGQRRGASGAFSTRSICRRALSVAGSPSKCTPSVICLFWQSVNHLVRPRGAAA